MCTKRSPAELFEPILKIDLSDQEWTDIKREGDLQDLYRPAIEALFFRYAATKTAKDDTRRTLQQLDDAMTKAISLVYEITNNPVVRRDYLYIGNVGEQGPNLPLLLAARDVFTAVKQEMAKTNDRFATANELLPPPKQSALEDFVYGLLFVQAESRQEHPPISVKEDSHNPKFRRYLDLCVSLAGPEEKQESIGYALRRTVGRFGNLRKEDPDGWSTHWDSFLRQQIK